MTRAGASAPQANPGETMRTVVAAVAGIAMVESIIGAVIGITAPADRLTTQLGIGAALATLGLVQGVGCLWHGARHHHERGHNAAIAAVLVGTVGVAAMLYPIFIRQ